MLAESIKPKFFTGIEDHKWCLKLWFDRFWPILKISLQPWPTLIHIYVWSRIILCPSKGMNNYVSGMSSIFHQIPSEVLLQILSYIFPMFLQKLSRDSFRKSVGKIVKSFQEFVRKLVQGFFFSVISLYIFFFQRAPSENFSWIFLVVNRNIFKYSSRSFCRGKFSQGLF